MKLIDRLTKISQVEDIDKQIGLAKQYMMRLRTEAKAKPTLAQKIATQQKVQNAEKTLRRLRMRSFDIEDAIKAGNYTPEEFLS
jgi:hypothetical protein